jgi:hypothetical protein
MQFNLEAIDKIVSRYIAEGNHSKLIARVGLEEFRNHVSCVFATKDDGRIAIELGAWLEDEYQVIPSDRLIVGFTPCYPVSCPNATYEQNLIFRGMCRHRLENHNIPYLDATGEALDFEKAPGCFIGIVKNLAELNFVLSDQLSCLLVDAYGKTQLYSLIN